MNKTQNKIDNKEIAIKVDHISKTFKIPHEKITSLRGAAVSLFKKNTYEEFKALDDVSFEVKRGEFFGVIGRNGSGKSTLLKILAGIYQADRGKVKIKGMISPFLELGIGFNPELSGRDNIYLNATVLGLTKKQIDEKFDSIVAFSELERFIDQKLKNYSSGMQVRLAFSVSIHANRDILLMDEVLAVGDSNFQSKCLTEFNKYREMGRTVVIVTHDIGVVQRYCDRAMLLRNGKIVKIGKADEVSNEYIYNNISDKEKELYSKKNIPEDRGTKEIVIKKVAILDENKKEKKVIISGKKVFFRIEFDVNRDIENVIFGLGIHLDDNNQYCIALNSFIDDKKITKEDLRRGYLDIEVPNLILNSGQYYINAIVAKNKFGFAKNPIHFVGKINSFHVNSLKYNEGLFYVTHYWK